MKDKNETLAEKQARKLKNKQKRIERIIEDLRENIYDSQEFIWDLCREALLTKTNTELKEINGEL